MKTFPKLVNSLAVLFVFGSLPVLLAVITRDMALALAADYTNVQLLAGVILMSFVTWTMAAAAIGAVKFSWQEPKSVEPSHFAECMVNARAMLQEARQCRAQGYPYAAKAAIQSAQSWRKAAHAHTHYSR